MQIDKFDGENRWLSNFHKSKVVMYGLEYLSVENAYQAAKENNPEERKKYLNISPGQAKKLGRKATLRPDWDKFRLVAMETLVRRKFKQPELREKLIATGDAELIEGNYWHDTFWGVCNGVGENNLGKILMKIRNEIIIEELAKKHF